MLQQINYKQYCLILSLFLESVSFGANARSHSDSLSRHRIKATTLDLSCIFLRTVKIGYEYKFKVKPIGTETELGFTHYSREENTYVKGYFYSLAGNYYIPSKGTNRFIAKLMPFYHKLFIDHYLKYDAAIDGFGRYYDYRKTKYTKERYGIYVMICWQHDFSRHFFFEFNYGVGAMRFVTHITDQNVTQEFYRNGLFNYKDYYSPTIMLNLKLGYAF
jgi:hypothetical protein